MAAEHLRFRLRESLKQALRERDQVATAALRSAVSAIDNAEAVEGPSRYHPRLGVGAGDVARRDLTEEEIVAVLRAEIAERVAAGEEYLRLGRPGDARRLESEAAVLRALLEEI